MAVVVGLVDVPERDVYNLCLTPPIVTPDINRDNDGRFKTGVSLSEDSWDMSQQFG